MANISHRKKEMKNIHYRLKNIWLGVKLIPFIFLHISLEKRLMRILNELFPGLIDLLCGASGYEQHMSGQWWLRWSTTKTFPSGPGHSSSEGSCLTAYLFLSRTDHIQYLVNVGIERPVPFASKA